MFGIFDWFSGEEKEAVHIERHFKSGIPPKGWRFTYDGHAYKVDCCGHPTGMRARKLSDKIYCTEHGLKMH